MSWSDPISLGDLKRSLEAPPLHRFLGLTLVSATPGTVTVALPYRDELLAETSPPYIHGGIIATLADVAACFAMISTVGYDVPTVDLRIDYLKPAGPVALEATGRTVRAGKMTGVADVEVRDAAGQVVAVARGLFSTHRKGAAS